MKNSTLVTRLIAAAVLLAMLAYGGFHAYRFFTDPYSTAVAYAFTSERAVSVSGYIVRQEEALPGGGELVYSSRGEGERVSAGGTVALIYQSAQALEDAAALRSLSDQLQQLRYAQSLTGGTQASVRLDDEVRAALLDFRAALAGGDTAGESAHTLRTAVLKRSYAYSGAGDLEAQAAALAAQVEALSAGTDPGTVRVRAPQSGLFSSLADGYEGVLNLENILTMTPEDYRAIAPAAGEPGVGKMVYGSQWAFMTLLSEADVGRLAEGDTVTLRLQKGLDRDLDMQVRYISAGEGGQRVVVLTSQQYLNLTTLLRRQNAQIIFASYSGIRVPRSSVRVEQAPVTDEEGQPVLDSNGQQKTQAVTCVFCQWGEFARRKPVEVLWQEEEYLLVAPDEEALAGAGSESAREGRRLRAGDTVILSAAEIYDGMVIH